MTMAMTALAIDVMLPAFGEIREAMDLPADSPDTAGLITAFFLGLAIAQLPAGVLADRFGRKPVLHIGLALYALGAIGAMFAPTLGWMLVARFLWGLGAGGPRVVAVAIVRDRYAGDQMARMMSLVMAMFILIPIVAPSIGSALLAVGPWQLVFGFCAVAATAVNVWAVRLPETLHPEHRRPLQLRPVLVGAKTVVRSRETVLLGVALTLATDGTPAPVLYLPLLALSLANHSLLVPNLNAAAMQPVGAVAGTASALLGTLSIAAGSLIASRIDHAFDGTVRPLSIAFFVSSFIALTCFTVAHRGRRTEGAVVVEPVPEPA